MIVKNGAAGLPRYIGSVRSLVDLIVIGDTGSTDRSVAVARELRAEVFHVAWTDDYPAARSANPRNQILSQQEELRSIRLTSAR